MSSVHFSRFFQFVSEPWKFPCRVKLIFHGSETNWKKTSTVHFSWFFQFVQEPWNFPYRAKLNFHGSCTNWICTRTMKISLLSQAKFSWFWNKLKNCSKLFFMVFQFVPEPWKFPYWGKLNFHGSCTNWKNESNSFFMVFSICFRTMKFSLLSQANFSWFWNKLKKMSAVHFSCFFQFVQEPWKFPY